MPDRESQPELASGTRRQVLKQGCSLVATTSLLSGSAATALSHDEHNWSLPRRQTTPRVIRTERQFNDLRAVGRIGSNFALGAGSQLLQITPENTIRWSVTASGQINHIAATSDGAFVGTTEGIEYVTASGESAWRRPVSNIRDMVAVTNGVCVISGEEIIRLGPDGTEEWTVQPDRLRGGVIERLSSHDGTVYVMGYEDGGPVGNPSLVALDGGQGRTDWSERVANIAGGSVGLAAGDGGVYLVYDYETGLSSDHSKYLYRYEDGTQVWQQTLYSSYRPGLGARLATTDPTVGSAGVYTNGDGDSITKVNRITGSVDWSGSLVPEAINATSDGPVVLGLAGDTGYLRKLSSDGLIDWEINLGAVYTSYSDDDVDEFFAGPFPIDAIDSGYGVVDMYNDRFVVVGADPAPETDDGTDEQATEGPTDGPQSTTQASPSDETAQTTTASPVPDDGSPVPTDSGGSSSQTPAPTPTADDTTGPLPVNLSLFESVVGILASVVTLIYTILKLFGSSSSS